MFLQVKFGPVFECEYCGFKHKIKEQQKFRYPLRNRKHAGYIKTVYQTVYLCRKCYETNLSRQIRGLFEPKLAPIRLQIEIEKPNKQSYRQERKRISHYKQKMGSY